MQRIQRKPIYLHMLLTMDVLFLDEAGQISAEMMAVFDIIMRKLRQSQVPFGGVLVLGTMDHTQIQPIKALPFLTSTLVMTCFSCVKLKHSVRAAAEPLFCEFQQLTRMNPLQLLSDERIDGKTHKERFYELANQLFEYVPSMSDDRVLPTMARMYAWKNPVKNAMALYTDDLIRSQRNSGQEGADFHIRHARDSQVRTQSHLE